MSRLSLVLLASAAFMAGCGSDDTASTTPATATVAGSTPTSASAVAGGDLTVVATEYAFKLSSETVKAGKTKLVLENAGKIEHEVVVLKTDAAADALEESGGEVLEDTSVGEVSETAAGAEKSETLDLEAGHYVLVCNISGHYGLGMRSELTVE